MQGSPMNKIFRLLRVEHQAAARRPVAGQYGPEEEARIVQRLTEVMQEQGGPEGLRLWLEALQERRAPSRLGVNWNELNEKVLCFSRLLWRDLHGNRD